ncbi:response regulator [Aquimarina sp. D1M17]|uniref:response regulator n=1 Tax=Aquimarina acroporae TaxID=2937283 RepID=UPI0020C15AC6|nr:response regulator [Aquimarina acroporae]MCK8522213.1 response regulator [Aquimarina acroporae]
MNHIVNSSLLIDDDKATTFFNRYLLLKHKAFKNVKTLHKGKDAIEYLKNIDHKLNLKPDLIFLDINMPLMNGWDFLEKFAQLKDEVIDGIKIVMLSTSTDPNDIQRAIENRFVSDFVNKPLTISIIDKVVHKHFSYKIAR